MNSKEIPLVILRRTQLCRDLEEDHAEAEDQEAVLVAEAEASAAVAEADSAEDTEADLAVPIIMDLTGPEVRISAADGSTVHITDEDITATEAVASVDLWVCFSCPSSLLFSH